MSELIRRASAPPMKLRKLRKKGEVWVIQSPPGTLKVNSRQIKDMLEDVPCGLAVAMHLLDVNALIALGWDAHTHHDTMVDGFNANATRGWGTCALTQAGFVQVLSQPALGQAQTTVIKLSESLQRQVGHPAHRFVPLDFTFEEVIRRYTGGVVGHRQIKDAYLLSAAMRVNMKLLTFDSGLSTLLATPAERSARIELLG